MNMDNTIGEIGFSLTINGAAAPSARWMDVVNPSTGKVFTRAPNAGSKELEAAVAAAKVAFPKWKALGASARRMDVGTVWINDNLNSSPATPLTGHKKFGFGAENGLAGLLEFTQIKAIFIPKPVAA
jgi:acyl-CoA reductase-like NAD-dependent aldehyde dehydrogenase